MDGSKRDKLRRRLLEQQEARIECGDDDNDGKSLVKLWMWKTLPQQ